MKNLRTLETLSQRLKTLTLQEIDNELARRSAVEFAKRLGFKADPWQNEVLAWKSGRLILNCSRQSGKSTVAALLALYEAITKPKQLILLVSPSERQSKELLKKVQDFIRDLPEDLRLPLTEDNKLSCAFSNGSRIVALPGEERTIRGFSGATLIIEDEAARVEEALYMGIKPMLAVSRGRLILMSTPFGKQGHFANVWNGDDPDWKRIKHPATENPRISKEFLEKEKKEMGEWWFKQEYMCEFMDDLNSVFSFETIKAAMVDDVKPLFPAVVA